MKNYTDFRFQSRDGLMLYARDYNRALRHAPVVLCLPGLTRNSADFAALADHLSERFRVLALDFRGRGRSDYDPDAMNYHPGTYVQDVLSLLDSLGVASASLIGTSLGGLVSMALAATAPTRVTSLILNDVAPALNPAGLARIRGYVGDVAPVPDWKAAAARARAVHGREFPDFTDSDWLAFARNLYREAPDGSLVLDYDPAIAVLFNEADPAAPPPDLWPVFSALPEVPLLLIRGALSDIVSPQVVARMQAQRPAMACVEVAGRGHAPLLTEAVCLKAIDKLLTQL